MLIFSSSHLCKKRFNVISGWFPEDPDVWFSSKRFLNLFFINQSILPLLLLFINHSRYSLTSWKLHRHTNTDIQTQTHRHTYTRLHQPIFVLLIRRGGRVGAYSMHALDLPNTSPWLWNSSCLRQLCSFILRGGNLQFGSRKFPHPVCLQSPGPLWWWRGVLVQTSQRRATLYTRHQTIRLTAGLTCAACFITLLCGNVTISCIFAANLYNCNIFKKKV